MCDPVTIGVATFALSAASTSLEHIGTNQAYHANKDAANYSYARDMDAIGRQDSQLQQERSNEAMDTAIAALKARGDISASASDMGLSSNSIVSSLNASMFGIGRSAVIEEKNFTNQRIELANSRTDAEIRRQNQINSKPRSGLLQLALGIGDAALSGAGATSSARKG